MLTSILKVATTWFHLMATIVLIGHYLVLELATLPVLKKTFSGQALFKILDDFSGQILPRIYASLGIFVVTGIYLMLVNPAYLGIGQFGNLWSAAMLAKHMVVLVMIGVAVFMNILTKKSLVSDAAAIKNVKSFDRLLFAMSAGGVVVILLTAIAQVQ